VQYLSPTQRYSPEAVHLLTALITSAVGAAKDKVFSATVPKALLQVNQFKDEDIQNIDIQWLHSEHSYFLSDKCK
jgi:hypothetical protein